MREPPTTIERLRVERGMTYEQVGLRAGCSADTVARYARGRCHRPRILTLRRIAEALGVDVWQLAEDYQRELEELRG